MHKHNLMKEIPDEILMEWISVKDKLPPEDEWILFCSEDQYIDMGMSLDGIFCIPDLNYLQRNNVTHWMPLPEPPMDPKKID